MRIPRTGLKYQSKADPYIPVTYELAIHNLTCAQVSCRRAETRGWTTDSHQRRSRPPAPRQVERRSSQHQPATRQVRSLTMHPKKKPLLFHTKKKRKKFRYSPQKIEKMFFQSERTHQGVPVPVQTRTGRSVFK
jgi:hypothetical protein